MKQKFIAIDFDGTLIRNEPANKAHCEWFNIMASALDDNSIKQYCALKDYFPKVYEVMERYTGLDSNKEIDKKLLRKFARTLFQMSYIGMANKLKRHILIKDFANYLKNLKKKGYKLALITTAPEDSVLPILEIANCPDLFDVICKSPLIEEPNKRILFDEFVKKHGKPLCYLGNADDDMAVCKELKITSVLVTWDKLSDKEAEDLADYKANSVEELQSIFEKEIGIKI